MVGVFGSSRPLHASLNCIATGVRRTGVRQGLVTLVARSSHTSSDTERDGAARLNAVCSPSGASLYPHSRHELLRLGTSRGQECPQPEQHTSHV